MLKFIHIRNYALVEELDLDIHTGMTALTGETGAGKSILLGAVGLALGGRANAESIRVGAKQADISLSFDISHNAAAKTWLEQHEMVVDDDCILRRVIGKDGRSKASINAIPVPVQRLKDLGKLLIEVHGQHAHHSLLDPASHCDLFDRFASAMSEKQALQQCCKRRSQCLQRHQELENLSGELQQRLDFINYQCQELVALALKDGEWDALHQEHKQLTSAQALLQDSADVQTMLADDGQSLRNQLMTAMQLLQPLQKLSPSIKSSIELLEQARIHVDEATDSLQQAFASASYDPERLQEIETRLEVMHDLARKHRVDASELPKLQANLEAEANDLQTNAEQLQELGAELAALDKEYDALAAKLSKKRSKALPKFNQAITSHMQTLGLGGGEFRANLQANDKRGPQGSEQIAFAVVTNPGQPARLLHKIASGGELSRISLAIEVTNLGHLDKPVLIFDEVDVGIGGSIADRVGQYLKDLSEQTQVMCVTHLAQVAIHAKNQCRIYKTTDGKQTATVVVPLDAQQRVDEVARMLGGEQLTAKTRQHAEEMLQQARVPST